MLKFLILLPVFYIIGKIAYVIRAKYRAKKAKDVEFDFNMFYDPIIEKKTLVVAAPFYDEMNGFLGEIGTRGINLGFTPSQTLPEIITDLFKDKYLLQIVVNDHQLPSREDVYNMGLRAFQKGIRHESGILIYTPEVLQKETIACSIFEGTDLFLICSELTEDHIRAFPEITKKTYYKDYKEVFEIFKEHLPIEGELLNRFEVWRLAHDDERVLSRFGNTVLDKSVDKLYQFNGLKRDSGVVLPDLDRLVLLKKKSDNVPIQCNLYFEDSEIVFYWSQGKKYDAVSITCPVNCVPERQKSFLSILRGYLIPELVPKRVFKRKNIFRYAVQYFFMSLATILFTVGLMNLGEILFGEIPVLFGIVVLPGVLFPVIGFPIAFVFFMQAIFSRKKLIRTII